MKPVESKKGKQFSTNFWQKETRSYSHSAHISFRFWLNFFMGKRFTLSFFVFVFLFTIQHRSLFFHNAFKNRPKLKMLFSSELYINRGLKRSKINIFPIINKKFMFWPKKPAILFSFVNGKEIFFRHLTKSTNNNFYDFNFKAPAEFFDLHNNINNFFSRFFFRLGCWKALVIFLPPIWEDFSISV